MSESDFHAYLRSRKSPAWPVPMGDDLAGINWPANMLLCGVDQVLDGVHFDSRVHVPQDIGRKAMNRNLSDVAAMAARPIAALVSIAAPGDVGLDYLKSLDHGLREAVARFDCHIIGGDTGSWPGKLAVSVSILAAPIGRVLTRRHAVVGDTIYVTGPLGGSILGRHMSFEPRLELAQKLASTHALTAMMDLSDGLARDLPRLCEASGVGAQLDAHRIPIHDDARRLPGDALLHAIGDGEDYELLFTSPEAIDTAIAIGTITPGNGVSWRRDGVVSPLPRGGWEHSL